MAQRACCEFDSSFIWCWWYKWHEDRKAKSTSILLSYIRKAQITFLHVHSNDFKAFRHKLSKSLSSTLKDVYAEMFVILVLVCILAGAVLSLFLWELAVVCCDNVVTVIAIASAVTIVFNSTWAGKPVVSNNLLKTKLFFTEHLHSSCSTPRTRVS